MIPTNEQAKDILQNQVEGENLRKPVADAMGELNDIAVTNTLKAICEQGTMITRMVNQENIGYSGNQTDSITVNEDREIQVTMKQTEATQGGSVGGSGVSIGVAGSGVCTIKGNVKEYIDDTTDNKIANVKVEILDENGNEIPLQDEHGNSIDGVRSDNNGNYEIKGVETVSVEINADDTFNIIEKKYTVRFTYGDEEQLKVNTKYNGQDYQSKTGVASTTITKEGGDTDSSEEIEELPPPQYEEEQKVDIYLLLDYSGSMRESVIDLKETFLALSDKIFELYGDNAKVGVATFSGITGITKEIPLSNENDYRNAIEGAFKDSKPGAKNYNHVAIDNAKAWLASEGRADSEKYIILIGDGQAVEYPEECRVAYENAKNDGMNMFSILIGDPYMTRLWLDFIKSTLAGTDWYYTPELKQGELFGDVISQYVSGNRDFVNNIEDLTEDGTATGVVGTAITLTRPEASIAEDDAGRRSQVNANINSINYTLRR